MKVACVYLNNECNVGRGAGYIASAVERAGHDLRFFDTFFTPPEVVAEKVCEDECDVVLLSAMTMLFPSALRLARLVKERRDIPIIAGGVHPTIVGAPLLAEHRELDYLCVGEGESTIVEFLDRLGKPSLTEVANLVYRRDGRVIANPVRPAEDLANEPPFPWRLFPREALVQPGQGFLYVSATRGCPFDCTYCCNGIYLHHYGKHYLRFRPVEDVLAELDMLRREYQPRLFYFGDEMVFSRRDYATELFQAIKQRLDVPFGCMARVEYINPQVVQLLAETGCRYLAMGIECGDEEFRKARLNRRMSNEQIVRAFQLVKQAGIFTTSFNMIGYPVDDDERLTQATIDLNHRAEPSFAQVSIFYPFPGTQLYKECVEKDLVDPAKLDRTSDYFTESVLRGVSLKERRAEVDRLLNPRGFKFRLGGAEDELADALDRCEALTGQLEDMEKRRQSAEEACQRWEAQCRSLQERVEMLNNMLEDTEKRRQSTEEACQRLEAQCRSLQERVEMLNNMLEQKEAARANVETMYAELAAVRNQLIADRDSLQQQLAMRMGIKGGTKELLRSLKRRISAADTAV